MDTALIPRKKDPHRDRRRQSAKEKQLEAQHWLEVVDSRHLYGSALEFYKYWAVQIDSQGKLRWARNGELVDTTAGKWKTLGDGMGIAPTDGQILYFNTVTVSVIPGLLKLNIIWAMQHGESIYHGRPNTRLYVTDEHILKKELKQSISSLL
ncbi:hypothetical protein BU17DRAFT_61250 [Hysterangium stoloniferum]|nr:hypothetical protein BU17DRAFT_61250 [Hysterangium stoloniferum]